MTLLGVPQHVLPRGNAAWASRFFVVEIEQAPPPPEPPLREDAVQR